MGEETENIEIGPAPGLASDSEVMDEEKRDELRSQALTAELSTLPKGYYLSPRFVGTFAGIAFSLTGTYLTFEAVAACLISINQDIGPSPNYYLVTIVWTIMQSIVFLLFGRNSDMFGRRNWALGANFISIIGGIVGATAKSMEQMIGAFVLLGLAAGVPGSYPLLTGELLTNKLKYLGTIMVVVPNIVATGFGPYLGLRLNNLASWRWIFYIHIILMVIGTVLWYFYYHPPSFTQLHGTKISRRHELAHIDYIGTLLLVGGLVIFLLGISWGGPYPWNSARVLGLLISGAIILVSFVLYETFAKIRNPIVPMHFFRDVRGFTCVAIISAIAGCLQTASFILWPSQVQYIFGSTASGWEEIAWMSSVVNFASWAGIISIGPLFHIIKHLRTQLLVGAIFMTAFTGAMSSINYANKSTAVAFAFLATFPMGWGEIFTMLLVQYLVPESSLGVAFAIVCSVRTILGSIFSSIFVAIYTNKLPGNFQDIVVPAVTSAGFPTANIPSLLTAAQSGSQAAIQAVPGMTSEILSITNISVADAYGKSYAYVYYTAAALGVICIGAAACLRDMDHYLTDHVARQVYHKEETRMDILEKAQTKQQEGFNQVENV